MTLTLSDRQHDVKYLTALQYAADFMQQFSCISPFVVHYVGMKEEPTFALTVLGTMLEQARDAAGLTAKEAARELNVVVTTLRRWELGQTVPARATVGYLAQMYGVDPTEESAWGTLAIKGKERGLFEPADIPASMKALVAAETRSVAISSLELEYIPGLLQTPAYHLAVQSIELPVPPEVAADVRTLRVQRQESVFGRKSPPDLEFIIGPAAMFYLRTWPEVEAEQLEHLRELARRPGVSIRVLTSPHAGMLGSFTLLKPPRTSVMRPVVYLESMDGIRYVEDPDVVSDYSATFNAVRSKSITIEEYMK
jgi:transcriptional regulator with XRE-family HTH domain